MLVTKEREEPTFNGLLVSLSEEEHCFGRSIRSLEQTLTQWILAYAGQQRAVRLRHFRQHRFAVQ